MVQGGRRVAGWMQEVRKVEHHVRRDGRVGAHLLGDDLVHDACLGAQYLVRIRVRVLRVRVKVRGRAIGLESCLADRGRHVGED